MSNAYALKWGSLTVELGGTQCIMKWSFCLVCVVISGPNIGMIGELDHHAL